MLESISSNNIFEYKKLTPEEQKQRGILGRLVGVIADCVKPTRNGRKYSAELWEKVFENPVMQEKIANRVCFGEACHPLDGREEVDPEKVAICLAEVPKKNKKGQLMGVFDILDTPCGRILKTMLDYGANIGVSSRGSGDVIDGYDGTEEVDPSTYDCICWDAVFVPAVKEARLQLVTESYNGKTLKQSLSEELNNASEKDKMLMEEVLDNYNINIDDEKEEIEDGKSQETGLHIEDDDTDLTVDDDKVNVVAQLQESLKKNLDYERKIADLQEKLSVCYAKEEKLNNQISLYRNSITRLSKQGSKISILENKNKTLNQQLTKNQNLIESYSVNTENLKRELQNKSNDRKALIKTINEKTSTINKLQSSINDLSTNNKTLQEEYDNKLNSLKNNVNDLQKKLLLKESEYSKKLDKVNNSIKKYKLIAESAVNKFIESQAVMLGVTTNEIKNKLPEHYTFDDINQVCESLREYKISINKLPFSKSNLNENMKIHSNNSNSLLPKSVDDEIDEQLLGLVKNNI